MPFADEFATCMTNAGIQVDAAAIPDEGTLAGVLDYLKQYIQSLGPEVAAGLDAATESDTVSVALADSEVGAVDSSYVGLLQAFDAASGFPLSLCLQWCDYCLEQARATATS